jgi:DNA mismatch endonuclease (patch repair protein)
MPPKKRRKDVLTKLERSQLMARVGQKNTKPELVVRSFLHANGFRYRLHRKDLPGSPDIVFPARMKVIFIHGCFWHRHKNCKYSTKPGTRTDFWEAKFVANVKRDINNLRLLKKLGWKADIVWECETKNLETLAKRIYRFLA